MQNRLMPFASYKEQPRTKALYSKIQFFLYRSVAEKHAKDGGSHFVACGPCLISVTDIISASSIHIWPRVAKSKLLLVASIKNLLNASETAFEDWNSVFNTRTVYELMYCIQRVVKARRFGLNGRANSQWTCLLFILIQSN